MYRLCSEQNKLARALQGKSFNVVVPRIDNISYRL
jgi:hypothetical protein